MVDARTVDSQSAPQQEAAVSAAASSQEKKKRTFGNIVFDLVVWPTIAFGGVFIFSAWLLKVTKFGRSGAGGFKDRYDGWVKSITEWMGKQKSFSHLPADEIATKAKHYVDVLISFAAGTILISPIKLFEDQRQSFAQAVDKLFGTTPKDSSQYQEEPQQSWLSVLGGRVLTFGIILAVSTAFGRKIDQVLEATSKFFVGGWKALNPAASAKTVEKVSQWSFVTAFEGFYTAVTTTLLYFISRTIAKKPSAQTNAPASVATAGTSASASVTTEQTTNPRPAATVTTAEHQATLQPPLTRKAMA